MSTLQDINLENGISIKSNNRQVTLTVKVNELYTGAGSLEDCTKISNENGHHAGFGDSKFDFTTKVKKLRRVTWTIEMENLDDEAKYQLRLFSISEKSDVDSTEIFNENPMYADSHNLITAKAVKGVKDDEFDYIITFIITDKNGNGLKSYPLDPKIRIQN